MSGFDGYGVRVGMAATTVADGGWYALQIQGYGEQSSASHYEWQPAFGFAARPKAADTDGACQVLYLADGDLAWCGHDKRHSAKCPPLAEGSSAQWSSQGAFSLLDAPTDTWTLYVPRDDGNAAHTVVAGQDANGSPYIELRHQNGAYVALTADSVVMRHMGNALIEVLGSEISLNGAVNTTASMTVGGAAAQPLVNATVLVSYLTALEAVLSTISAATVPTTAPAVTAFIAASAALKTAMQTQMIRGL